MSIYVISTIKRNHSLVGMRLFSEDTRTVVNTRIEQVIQYIKDGKDIRNLSLRNEEIDWVQGAIDRYPVIEADSLQVLENKNSLIVLGYRVNDASGEYIYSVANYIGQVVEIDEAKLIQYAEQYQLANCKLVSKSGSKKYIASLGGELKQLTSEVVWEYDNYYRELTCRLPDVDVNKLIIPSRIKGDKVVYPCEIVVTPLNKANNVTHIKMSNGIEMLSGKLFTPFTRLRYLDIDCNINFIGDSFKHNYYLEEIRIKQMNDGIIPRHLFRDLVNLKRITVDGCIVEIRNSAFRGCKGLDVQGILKEGLIVIDDRAFEKCGMEEIEFPKSLSIIDITALDNCKNLRKVVFNSSKLDIKDNRHIEKEKMTPLLHGCGNVDLYIPFGTHIKDMVGTNVTVHESQPTSGDLRAKKIEQKASIIGVDVSAHKIAQTPSEVLGILTSITEDDWKKLVNEMLRDTKNGVKTSVIRGVDGLKFECNSLLYLGTEVKKIQVSENFALIWENLRIKAVFINMEVCKNVLRELASKNLKYGMSNHRNMRYAYSLPYKTI